jgi:hypothetical protein
MAKKSSFLLRGNTILKIQFEFAPSNREIELLIAFFGLPNAIDNPLPLIVIKANIELGDNGSQLKIDLVLKIVKCVTRFFANIDNHIMEGTVPDLVPTFTPRDANPKILNTVAPVAEIAALKVKPDALPPGTPARERNGKKQKVKPAAGATDFRKAGLFRCKEGTPIAELFPNDLEKKLCSFFSFHEKKCTKPSQACYFAHIGKWDKIPAGDQAKILEHCHAGAKKFGWMLILSRSTKSRSLRSTLTS